VNDSQIKAISSNNSRIINLEVCDVPAPAGATHPGTHLLINCVYDCTCNFAVSAHQLPAYRTDVRAIIDAILTESHIRDYTSVCITLLSPRKDAACRLYRYSALTSDLVRAIRTDRNSNIFSSDFSIETSDIAEVRDDINWMK